MRLFLARRKKESENKQQRYHSNIELPGPAGREHIQRVKALNRKKPQTIVYLALCLPLGRPRLVAGGSEGSGSSSAPFDGPLAVVVFVSGGGCDAASVSVVCTGTSLPSGRQHCVKKSRAFLLREFWKL